MRLVGKTVNKIGRKDITNQPLSTINWSWLGILFIVSQIIRSVAREVVIILKTDQGTNQAIQAVSNTIQTKKLSV